MSELTRAQRLALDLSRSVALSAGAGSGKTRVLVERYLWTLGAAARPAEQIDRTLAITFTEKAAQEMGARVRSTVAERARSDPRIATIAQCIERARISTIHGFCARLLREQALAAGLDPEFRILSGADAAILFSQTLRDFLTAAAEAFDPDLAVLVELWSRGQIERALGSLAAKRYLANRWAGGLESVGDEELLRRWRALSPLASGALSALRDSLAGDLREVADADADDPIVAAASALLGAASGRALEVAFAALVRAFLDASGRSLRKIPHRKSGWQVAARRISAVLREREQDVFGVLPALDEQAPAVLRALARVFRGLLAAYRARKEELVALDFDDLEEQVLALLRRDAALKRSIQERAGAVLVDEAQDVSELQWELLWELVSEGKKLRPRALFAVGDVKQSIYRFRGAEVTVFGRIEEAVAAANAALADEPPLLPPGPEVSWESERERLGLLSLRQSFRADPRVLHFTNRLFDEIFGRAARPFEARPQRLLASRTSGAETVVSGVDLVYAAAVTQQEEEEELLSPLGEAALTAAYLASGRWCSRREPGALPWGDCAVLLRRRHNLKLFETELRRRGIPFHVVGGAGFFEAQEVVDVLSLISFLADDRGDVDLATVLRSPLGAFTDDLLFRVATAGSGSLWRRLVRFAEARDPDAPPGRELAEEVFERLRRWRALAERVAPSSLVWTALEESGTYAALAGGPRGPQRLANIDKLLELLRRFEMEAEMGLAAVADRLRALAQSEQREGEAEVPAASGRVNLLTVHAAKGLEFPLVIVPEIGTPLPPDADLVPLEALGQGEAGAHLEVGIKLPDPERGYALVDTGIRTMVRAEAKAQRVAESKRLLYVACTRARDRLVLVSTPTARSDTWHAAICDALSMDRRQPALGVWGEGDGAFEVLDYTAFAATPGMEMDDQVEVDPGPEEVAEVRKGLLPLAEGTMALKLWPSVCGLLRECRVKAALALRGVAESPAGPAMAALRGSLIHKLLEARAWREPEPQSLARRFAAELVSLSPSERKELAAQAATVVEAFGKGELARRIENAQAVLRELPFLLIDEGLELSGSIDLAIREPDGWTIVDYKTDRVSEADALRVAFERGYDLQLRLYVAAARQWLEGEVRGALHFAATGFTFPLDTSLERTDEALAWLRREAAVLGATLPEPPLEAPCERCGYRGAVCVGSERFVAGDGRPE